MAFVSMKESGMKETLAAFHEYSAVLEEELAVTLGEIGREIKAKAHANALGQGLTGAGKYGPSRDQHPGALADKMRIRVSAKKVSVTAYSRTRSAKYPGGYPYPRRYEYGGRPFMVPALEEEREPGIEALSRMADRVRDRVGLGAGGI